MKQPQDILTMPHDQLEAIQLEGIKKTVITCYENVEFYHNLFDEAGFDPYAVAHVLRYDRRRHRCGLYRPRP